MLQKVSFIFIMNKWLGGGTERVLENIVPCLSNSFEQSKIYLYLIERLNKSLYSLPENIILIESINELLRIKKDNSRKVVVNFSGYWKSGAVAFFIFKKYISWCHNNPYILRKAKTGIFNFWLLKKSQKIVVICKEQEEILRNVYNFKNSMELIYNAVDIDKIQNLSLSEKLNFNSKYFLMSARFEIAQKDFFTLLEAYSLLDEEIQDNVKLVLIGTGPDENIIKKMAKDLGIEKNVYFMGFQNNPYVWMRNAEACILSSNYEGFSLVVIEEMIMKKNVILTDYHTGAREVSNEGKNAIIIPMRNSLEMKNALESIVTNKINKEELIYNAYNFAENNFSIKVFHNKIKQLFEGILNNA